MDKLVFSLIDTIFDGFSIKDFELKIRRIKAVNSKYEHAIC